MSSEQPSPPSDSYAARQVELLELSDGELLHLVAQNDENAMRLLYQRYSSLVFSLARRMLRDQARAEEILQETFIRVWRMAHTFDVQRGRVESWIVTIARNLTISLMRRTVPTSLEEHLDEMHVIADEEAGPEEAAWNNARRQMVRQALAQLPPAQQRMVLLAYFDGLSQTEIAARTGEPLGTVKSRLRLALHKLETLLQADLREEAIPYGKPSKQKERRNDQ